jgi:DNA repair exonuclease SbcCD nuclease subunit
VAQRVDFILITGDFFDVNVPDLAPVKRAVEVLKGARERGVEIYLIYGSHDFSPNTVSMIDILHSAGLFLKPMDGVMVDGKLSLKFIVDEKTGAKITGLSGRARELDVPSYKLLDLASLEAEPGFKIFLMHAPIAEITPAALVYGEGVPIDSLPRGFRYYGGGHLHKKIEHTTPEGGRIVYPGPLFGATFNDLEETAQGEKRGFYIVTFNSNAVTDVRFNEVSVAEIVYRTIDAEGKTARQVEEKLGAAVQELDSANKIVLVKVSGKLSSGRRADIDFSKLEQSLIQKGTTAWFINRNGLVSSEAAELHVVGSSREEIEERILKERTARFSVDPTITDWRVRNALQSKLPGESGERLAKDLLRGLKTEKLENEKNDDFETRLTVEIQPIVEPKELSTTETRPEKQN